MIVVDSVAALVPRAELEGDMGDPQMGLQARLMSQALRKLTGIVSKSRTCLIFINQIREKIGVMFGNPETTTGGRALKFYSSIRLDIRRIQSIKEGDRVIGSRTRAKVVKNKVAAPFREAEFDILYGEGISREGDLIDLGVEQGVLEKSGTWISFGGERLGQGRENARIFLKEHVDVRGKARGICCARRWAFPFLAQSMVQPLRRPHPTKRLTNRRRSRAVQAAAAAAVSAPMLQPSRVPPPDNRPCEHGFRSCTRVPHP